MAKQRRFTEAEVDYLIRAKKYIFAIPDIKEEDGGWFAMRAEVRKKDDESWQRGGLMIYARVKKAISNVPRGLPSCVIQWHGYRIRGVDYEVRHDNPDGQPVRGWHEHIWNDEDEDSRVIPASPAVKKPDLGGI